MILRPIFTVFSLSKRNSHYCCFSRWCSLPDLSVRHTALGKTLLKILPNYWDVSIWGVQTSKPYPSCWYLAHHETCRSSACPSWDMQVVLKMRNGDFGYPSQCREVWAIYTIASHVMQSLSFFIFNKVAFANYEKRHCDMAQYTNIIPFSSIVKLKILNLIFNA